MTWRLSKKPHQQQTFSAGLCCRLSSPHTTSFRLTFFHENCRPHRPQEPVGPRVLAPPPLPASGLSETSPPQNRRIPPPPVPREQANQRYTLQ
ncbi:hypothetical protein MRX96_038163 [Rhipicephalus microplus]